MLVLAAAGIGFVAELLVSSAESMGEQLGWNHVFIGVILLAIIGNAAEHSTAIVVARKNDMDTAMTICFQSSLQIALFVTPFLIILSAVLVSTGAFMGAVPEDQRVALNLLFSPMEIVAVLLAVMIMMALTLNGETNWYEGVLLLALYAIIAIAFFYIPSGTAPAASH
jgi:Ca2+:H+ antiporter